MKAALETRLMNRDERRQWAHAAAADLAGMSTAEERRRAVERMRFPGPELAEVLLGMARERRRDGESAAEWATLAVLAHCPEPPLDVAVLALAELGNALRLTGRYRAAARAFERANSGLSAAADELTGAEVAVLQASLEVALERTDAALELLRQAEATATRFGAEDLWARAEIKRSHVLLQAERAAEAVPVLLSALQSGRLDHSPRLTLAAVGNLADALADCDHLGEAVAVLMEWETVFTLDERAQHHRLWMLGLIGTRLGLFALGQGFLESAAVWFEQHGSAHERLEMDVSLLELYTRSGQRGAAAAAARRVLGATLERSSPAGWQATAAAVLEALEAPQGWPVVGLERLRVMIRSGRRGTPSD